ncbi:MAG: alginate export family protein, partial [Verrucomicrobiota bacterium]
AGGKGGDQALALRTTLLAQLTLDPARVVVEAMDSRQYLGDDGSPLDPTLVNPLDLLQAHLRLDLGDWFGAGRHTVQVGRETLDLGNRRLVSRNAYRNTINAFTGVDWQWEAPRGGAWVRAFFLLPVQRLPRDRASLADHELVADSQSLDQQFFGLYAGWPDLPAGVRAETYWLRLREEATYDPRGRDLQTPGLRLHRRPAAGRWDFEVESALQFGSSRGPVPAQARALDHLAHLQHLTLGYTLEGRLRPRFGLRYDYASGDRDPDDRAQGRFDTLYGARRFEFGPTGIYGAIGRANLNSPEYHLSLQLPRRLELGASHRFLWLASARDAWTPALVRDTSGAAGSELGQQAEVRLRWEVRPGNLRVDTGYVHLFAGSFLQKAPNATRQGDTGYAWFELTLSY